MSPNFAPQPDHPMGDEPDFGLSPTSDSQRADPKIHTPAEGSTKLAGVSLDRISTLEHEQSSIKQRLGWHIAAWWVLFALVLVSWLGFGAWNLFDTRTVRLEYGGADNRLDKRIDDKDAQNQSRLDLRSLSLDARVDAILRDISALESELATLRVKVESQEAMCQNACAGQTK